MSHFSLICPRLQLLSLVAPTPLSYSHKTLSGYLAAAIAGLENLRCPFQESILRIQWHYAFRALFVLVLAFAHLPEVQAYFI